MRHPRTSETHLTTAEKQITFMDIDCAGLVRGGVVLVVAFGLIPGLLRHWQRNNGSGAPGNVRGVVSSSNEAFRASVADVQLGPSHAQDWPIPCTSSPTDPLSQGSAVIKPRAPATGAGGSEFKALEASTEAPRLATSGKIPGAGNGQRSLHAILPPASRVRWERLPPSIAHSIPAHIIPAGPFPNRATSQGLRWGRRLAGDRPRLSRPPLREFLSPGGPQTTNEGCAPGTKNGKPSL